jgi:hypothetical protein
LTSSGINALPSFSGASTISSSSRLVVEGMFQESSVIYSFKKRSQAKTDKLVLQEWGFCGWAGNPPK